MFEKLLSLLPYNPSLVHQMSFYSQRMREEASIRRIGVIFLVLTFMVQFFAVLSPPKPTSAATVSNNDMILSKINSPKDIKQKCDDNTRHYAQILDYYGISCADVGKAGTVKLHSNGANGRYYSMGWLPQGKFNNATGKPTDETAVSNIPGLPAPVYWRLLASWDQGPNPPPYTALKVTSSLTGKTFYILYRCGNLVSVGVPTPYVKPKSPIIIPKPPIVIPKTTTPVTPVTPVPAPTPTPTPCPYDSSILVTDSGCKSCPYNSNIGIHDAACKPCDQSVDNQDTIACVSIHKTASNVTAAISDANNTTASPGDTITYTLYAENTGKEIVKDFVFQENLSDVLDYADVTNLYGGTIDDAEKTVTWPAETIEAGKTATHQITVKVKDPIPQTPVGTTDPNHFDLIMTNVYGNAINIKLPDSPTKSVETAAATLPNTGPGTSLFIGGAIVMVAGYFYSRSRLLAKEGVLAIKETATA